VKRLVCIVEGEGEVEAMPHLCARALVHLGIYHWRVDPSPIRWPRSKLVDERARSPSRPPHFEGIAGAMALARRRPADAVLLLVDSDDDCPVHWGPAAAEAASRLLPSVAVMAVREYESWLLESFPAETLLALGLAGPASERRGAKELLKKLVPGYKPTTHQLAITRTIDLAAVRGRSESFDKLMRSIEQVCRPA